MIMVNTLLLILYALIGVVMAIAGIEAFRAKDNPARIGTGLFWEIMAVIFAFGTLMPAMVVGVLVVIIGILALFKQIQIGKIKPVDGAHAATAAKRLGGWVFVPSVVLAVVSIGVAQFTKLGGQVGIGIGAAV
ncbi:putative membrane protein, partial [Lacticaseibacillus paracasei subsp. paracasei CNCM I-4648]